MCIGVGGEGLGETLNLDLRSHRMGYSQSVLGTNERKKKGGTRPQPPPNHHYSGSAVQCSTALETANSPCPTPLFAVLVPLFLLFKFLGKVHSLILFPAL